MIWKCCLKFQQPTHNETKYGLHLRKQVIQLQTIQKLNQARNKCVKLLKQVLVAQCQCCYVITTFNVFINSN